MAGSLSTTSARRARGRDLNCAAVTRGTRTRAGGVGAPAAGVVGVADGDGRGGRPVALGVTLAVIEGVVRDEGVTDAVAIGENEGDTVTLVELLVLAEATAELVAVKVADAVGELVAEGDGVGGNRHTFA